MSAPHFENTYAQLPAQFHNRQAADPAPNPELIRLNEALIEQLGLDKSWLESAAGLDMLSGRTFPDSADPIATVYAGFQFGSWNPQLGDGRALLIGEVVAPDGHRYDIQLKGSGRTPYSRGGDGKSPLGPVLREYIVSEAMYALGVPTTRALAAVTTGEPVYREQALPGAILTRVASSHIRVGTMQYFASRKDSDALRALCEHVIERHYPEAAQSDNPIEALLFAVIDAQANLIAQWQGLGFIHGVMNTDNMLLCGETIDYGPCAFMETYHPATVFSSIDHGGRYAYGNQPGIAHWNLAGLAQALLPILHEDEDQATKIAQDAVDAFPQRFIAAYQSVIALKLGLADYREDDDKLYQQLLEIMDAEKADFTLSFRRLSELANNSDGPAQTLFELGEAFTDWLESWRQRCQQDSLTPDERAAQMKNANPLFIARNHKVEEAIQAANDGDFEPFHHLLAVIWQPYTDHAERLDYAKPASPKEAVSQTFCGT